MKRSSFATKFKGYIIENRPLLDPVNCGEDLIYNAGRAILLAPMGCINCGGYHSRFTARRVSEELLQRPPTSIALDRPHLIALLKAHFETAILNSNTRSFNIVIPGAADTGILATCAHAAALLGNEVLGRCNITVIDRCATPLELCKEFAERHNFSIKTLQHDFLINPPMLSADLVVAHSLLRFFEPNEQIDVLNLFGSWLNKDGKLILSHGFREKITLENPGEIASLDHARHLFAQSNLQELSSEVLQFKIKSAEGGFVTKERMIAILGI